MRRGGPCLNLIAALGLAAPFNIDLTLLFYFVFLGSPDDIFVGKHIFYLIIDQEIVNDSLLDFRESAVALFLSYYVMNIEYPEGAKLTLEFFQR